MSADATYDLPDPLTRDVFRGGRSRTLVALKRDTPSIRFRPMLDLDAASMEEELAIVERALHNSRRDGAKL